MSSIQNVNPVELTINYSARVAMFRQKGCVGYDLPFRWADEFMNGLRTAEKFPTSTVYEDVGIRVFSDELLEIYRLECWEKKRLLLLKIKVIDNACSNLSELSLHQ